MACHRHPLRIKIRPWYNENLLSRWFIIPGIIGLLTLVITTIVTGLSVAREREAGTFDQLLVTPLRPLDILIGKSVPGILIGLVEGTFILLIAVYWFEIPITRQSWCTVPRPVFIPAVGSRRRTDDLLSGRHAAARHPWCLSVPGTVSDPVRLRHADCQHAGIRAAADADQPH